MKSRRFVPRNVFSLGFVSFLNDAASEMIYPLLPFFITSVLGAGPKSVGVIEGIAESTSSILKLFSGWVSDRMGRRKAFVVGGYVLANAVRPLIGVASSVYQVFGIRFADRFGKGVRTSPRDALIADSCAEDERGRAFGFHRAMDHAGAFTGPLIASVLLWAFLGENYRLLFLLSFIPGFLAVLFLIFGVKETKPPEKKADMPKFLTIKPFSGRFKFYLFVVALFTLGNSTDAFLLLRAGEAGVAVKNLGILWSVFHITKALGSVPAGMVSDKIGRKWVIIAGWLVYSAVYFGFGFAAEAYQIWLLFLVYGLYYALTEGVEKALVADMVPEHLRGSAYGLYNFAVGILMLPASLIMGFLYENLGSQIAFSFGAVLALVSAVLLLFVKPYLTYTARTA